MAAGEDWHQLIPAGEPSYDIADGVNVWPMLAHGAASPRHELVLEAHADESLVHGNAFIQGDWKILRFGSVIRNDENGWFPPPGQDANRTPYTLACGPPPARVDLEECTREYW